MSKYSDCSFLNMIDYSEGRLFKPFHSAILQYSGKKYGGDFWVIILSVRYLQYFIWYLIIFWEINGTKYQVFGIEVTKRTKSRFRWGWGPEKFLMWGASEQLFLKFYEL